MEHDATHIQLHPEVEQIKLAMFIDPSQFILLILPDKHIINDPQQLP